jgi:nucleoid-associated protein YgaU
MNDNKSDHRPPHVAFVWGSFRWPAQTTDRSTKAVFESFNQKFTLFAENGKPVRAEITVGLKQVDLPAGGQNPTSRATGARRLRTVAAGDTIDLLAAQELGSPTEWRRLAILNDLEDPRRLRPGQVLLIPAEV